MQVVRAAVEPRRGGATCFDVELPKVGKKIWARQSARMAQIRRD